MSDQEELDLGGAGPTRSGTRAGVKIALVAAGIAAGAIGATALGASAATNGSGSVSTYATAATPANGTATANASDNDGDGPHGDGVGGGPGGRNPNEKALDATLTAKLKAAALAKVPGATVDRVETDSGDATYEAHLTKSDGSRVTVKFDKSGNVTAVEQGMGK
jgi:uncharacterized membrane protein YkoI